MKWGEAARRRAGLEERLVALDAELVRLDAEVLAAERGRLALAALMDQRADETTERLNALLQRIETLEIALGDAPRADEPVDEARLAKALLPLKLEIAAVAQQAAADERQAQRAYLELVSRMDRMGPGGGDARPERYNAAS